MSCADQWTGGQLKRADNWVDRTEVQCLVSVIFRRMIILRECREQDQWIETGIVDHDTPQ